MLSHCRVPGTEKLRSRSGNVVQDTLKAVLSVWLPTNLMRWYLSVITIAQPKNMNTENPTLP